MSDLAPEEFHWLRLLKENRPGNHVSELPIPNQVAAILLALNLAYRRPGSTSLEITFEGIQEIQEYGDLGAAEKLCLIALAVSPIGPATARRIPANVRDLLLAKQLVRWNLSLLEVTRKGAEVAARLRRPRSERLRQDLRR